ncbi:MULTISPECIES: hypothetical protein [Ralstonia]|jgi:hypothetical protein|uniref:Uncharacterized protein n=2 Tax=Ralstonia pickettii TaxID=329 RepID=R0CNB6_RALPI|nr:MULTISPECIES: hypothetical protein [Ralstonia]ENZ77975.1 hypothetical protein OR214_02251 [Ralstonia pickettii OR214]MCM3581932.1 hypothetical protein [Ralstonia pickettii]
MSTQTESIAMEAMAEKIARLERQLASMQSAPPDLPSVLGDFMRILRSHGIATVFHAGHIEPINGGTATDSLRGAVEQFGQREHISADCRARIFQEICGSLFDATGGLNAVKNAEWVG